MYGVIIYIYSNLTFPELKFDLSRLTAKGAKRGTGLYLDWKNCVGAGTNLFVCLMKMNFIVLCVTLNALSCVQQARMPCNIFRKCVFGLAFV